MKISKNNILTYILLIFSILILDVFRLTPLSKYANVLTIIFGAIGFILLVLKSNYFAAPLKNWVKLFLLVLLISTLTSNVYYGQSIVSGVIANVPILKIGALLLVYYIFISFNVDLRKFVSIFVSFGWVLFLAYLLMWIFNISFTNISDLTDEIVEVNVTKLTFNYLIVVAFYYLALFFKSAKIVNLLYFIILISVNHWGGIQRGALLSVVILLFVYIYYSKHNITSSVKLISFLFVVLLLVIPILSVLNIASPVFEKFESSFATVVGQESNDDDASSKIRIIESEFALSKFYIRPILGNGNMRSSSKNLFIDEGFHFYVSDIGLIGILYSLGIFGLCVYIRQIYYWVKMLRSKSTQLLITTSILSIGYFIVISIITGIVINQPLVFLFPLMLIYLNNYFGFED